MFPRLYGYNVCRPTRMAWDVEGVHRSWVVFREGAGWIFRELQSVTGGTIFPVWGVGD